jgi:hypothetical protein
MPCSKGYIKRSGYTRQTKSGKIGVQPKCIKAISQSGKKRVDMDKKLLKKLETIHSKARKIFGTPKCKSGYILREGYHRKKSMRSGVKKIKSRWISPKCIKSKSGRPHGKQLFVLEKGTLSKFGYSKINDLTLTQRKEALHKALQQLKPITIFKKLNAVSTLNKNTNPPLSKMFKRDANWVKSNYMI